MAKTKGQKRKISSVEQEHIEPKSSLPDLLPGSQFRISDAEQRRAANLLGQAIAIVIQADKDAVKEDGRKKLLEAFEVERAKVEEFKQKRAKFRQQHPQHPDDRNASPDDPLKYPKRIQAWLEGALFGGIDWHGLYELIYLQVGLYKTYRSDRTDWWQRIQSVCESVATATDSAFDPINEIQKISENYRRAEIEQSKGQKAKPKKHGKGKLNEKVKNILQAEPTLSAGEIVEKMTRGVGQVTTESSVRQTEAWTARRKAERNR
jgi:hypothetical protein